MLLTLICVAGIILALALAFCVLGLLIARLSRWHWLFGQGPGFSAVVGVCATILFLEVWNFFLPINHATVAVLGGLTFCLMVIFWRTVTGTILDWFRRLNLLAIGLPLVLLLTVSLFGLGPAEHWHYDTGLYYLNTIRWAQAYPVVPGLANLHARLGYNQSLFLLLAFLSRVMGLGLRGACQLVNPILVFIAGWAIADSIRTNLTDGKAQRKRLYSILLLCPLFFLASYFYISAPTSDIAAAALALPGALAFLCCLEEIFESNPAGARNWLLVLVVCGCTIAKIKLSYAVLEGAALVIATGALIFVHRPNFLSLGLRITAVAAIAVVPWLARGVVLSGYPLYPSTFIRFRTDWELPRKYAENERLWICSWAKWPDKPRSEVLGNDAWFTPWVERNAKDPEKLFLFMFVTAGAVSALLSLAAPMDRQRRLISVLLITQTSLALLFWFRTAPDPRFAFATLMLFGVNGFYSFISGISSPSVIRSSICAGLIVAGCLWCFSSIQLPLIEQAEKTFPQTFSKADLEYETTTSGLRIGVPTKSDQIWDSGLLVTPYFDESLTLRGRTLRDGFCLRDAPRKPDASSGK